MCFERFNCNKNILLNFFCYGYLGTGLSVRMFAEIRPFVAASPKIP